MATISRIRFCLLTVVLALVVLNCIALPSPSQERDEPLLSLLQKQPVIGYTNADGIVTIYLIAESSMDDALELRREYDMLNHSFSEGEIDAEEHRRELNELSAGLQSRLGQYFSYFVTSRGPDYIGFTRPGGDELIVPRDKVSLVRRKRD